jgi:hypothetical protein
MMQRKINLILAIFFISCQFSLAQNNRLTTSNTIGWYNYFGTFKLSEKTGIHTEYQWRRNDLISSWQQGLLRVGLNYNVTPRALFRVGYAWAETFPYGNMPSINLVENLQNTAYSKWFNYLTRRVS